MGLNDTRIPSSYALRLLEQAAASGCDKQEILRALDMEWGELQNAEDISARRYALLYQTVMRSAEDEWFGMFVGGKVPLGSFRLMCLSLLSCATLHQAIIRAGEFAEVCRGMKVKFLIDIHEELACLTMAPVRYCGAEEFAELIAQAQPSYILTSIITWHKFSEWLTGKAIALASIELSAAQDQTVQPLAYVKENNIHFNSESNGFRFPASCLNYPVVQDHDSLMAFLRTAPYHLVTDDPLKLSFAEKVRNILKRDVSRAMPSAERLAEQLNMSVTTLRRQLAKGGTSYQKLKDDCRMEAAIHYLSCAELSNTDIAEKLGFDEPSAFFRSFKKWTGQTPGEYRARLD